MSAPKHREPESTPASFSFSHVVAHGYNCRIPIFANFTGDEKTFPNVRISEDYFYSLISLCAQSIGESHFHFFIHSNWVPTSLLMETALMRLKDV